MPYGVVLLPDRETHDRLVALAAATGGPDPVHVLGERAPAHVSVVHFDGDPAQARRVASRLSGHPVRTLSAKIIGLLFAVVPHGDYYVPQGGVYFGLEVVRRPDLDTLHREVIGWVRDAGATPLGAVGDDFRPHVTLGVRRGGTPGVAADRPVVPDLSAVPVGEIRLTPAFGELGPYGTFPGLRPGNA